MVCDNVTAVIRPLVLVVAVVEAIVEAGVLKVVVVEARV